MNNDISKFNNIDRRLDAVFFMCWTINNHERDRNKNKTPTAMSHSKQKQEFSFFLQRTARTN